MAIELEPEVITKSLTLIRVSIENLDDDYKKRIVIEYKIGSDKRMFELVKEVYNDFYFNVWTEGKDILQLIKDNETSLSTLTVDPALAEEQFRAKIFVPEEPEPEQ